jgi:hypothetical protein
MASDEYARSRWSKKPGDFTNVRGDRPKLGLFRGQARRHGMQTENWGQEPEEDSHPRFQSITSAMSPGTQGKSKSGHGFKFSNMQPRR